MEQFCEKVNELFDVKVTPETKYRDIEGWSSLGAVMLAQMIEENYGREITNADLKNNETIKDLYELCL